MHEYWTALQDLRQYQDHRAWIAVAAEQGRVIDFHGDCANDTRDKIAEWFMNGSMDTAGGEWLRCFQIYNFFCYSFC